MRFYKRHRSSYWSSSNFVRKVQGKPERQPRAFTSVDEMLDELSKPEPLIEKIIDKLQDIYTFPLDLLHSVVVYLRNRKGNTHVLDGGLERGVWYDLDNRIAHCLFFELDKFITKEKGLANHEWEKKLTYDEDWDIGKDNPKYGTPTDQALAAIEQDEIWNWWKENKNYGERDFVSFEQDAEHRKQEDEMLIRLIKIRSSLWT